MLEAQQFTLKRGTLQWVHDFRLAPGHALGLVGESGSGKTTLLEALGGFLPAEAGALVMDGRQLTTLPPEQRPVSTLFQHHNLFEHIRVADNLKLGFRKGRPTADQWQAVTQACDHLGIGELLQRYPGELSGGQRQRVALVRTVMRPQPLVVLDEPFSALDGDNRLRAGDWMRRQITSSNRYLIFVTHQPADTARWADEVLHLQQPLSDERRCD